MSEDLQYNPRAHVGNSRCGTFDRANDIVDGRTAESDIAATTDREVRYSDINRPVASSEVEAVRKAADAAGL